jgi:Holliday junction DNA helicase RuvA
VSGVGYEVMVPESFYSQLPIPGEEIELWIHTWYQENGIVLFGFSDQDQQSLFKLLLKVSGIGPRLALSILSQFSPYQFKSLIIKGDIKKLQMIPKVGRKLAELMILELRDKMNRLKLKIEPQRLAEPDIRDDVISALVNLGYKYSIVEAAVKRAETSLEILEFKPLFKKALKLISDIQ